jgi:hypothetical protein
MKNSTDLISEILKKPAPKAEKIKTPVAKPDTARIDSTKVVIPTPVDSSKTNAPTDSTINAPIDLTKIPEEVKETATENIKSQYEFN